MWTTEDTSHTRENAHLIVLKVVDGAQRKHVSHGLTERAKGVSNLGRQCLPRVVPRLTVDLLRIRRRRARRAALRRRSSSGGLGLISIPDFQGYVIYHQRICSRTVQIPYHRRRGDRGRDKPNGLAPPAASQGEKGPAANPVPSHHYPESHRREGAAASVAAQSRHRCRLLPFLLLMRGRRGGDGEDEVVMARTRWQWERATPPSQSVAVAGGEKEVGRRRLLRGWTVKDEDSWGIRVEDGLVGQEATAQSISPVFFFV